MSTGSVDGMTSRGLGVAALRRFIGQTVLAFLSMKNFRMSTQHSIKTIQFCTENITITHTQTIRDQETKRQYTYTECPLTLILFINLNKTRVLDISSFNVI